MISLRLCASAVSLLSAAACTSSPPALPYTVEIMDAPADVVAGRRALDCTGLDRTTVQLCIDYWQGAKYAGGYKQHVSAPRLLLATVNGAGSGIGLAPVYPYAPGVTAAQAGANELAAQFNVMNANDNAIVWNYLEQKGLARTIRGEPGAYLVVGPHP